MKWTAGGYDKQALSNVYSLSGKVAERRADLIVNSLQRYVTDVLAVKGLGFCVSVEHASFMSDYFNQMGIPSLCLTGQSPQADRDSARKRLAQGKLNFIFAVDIYNEGVDIPEITYTRDQILVAMDFDKPNTVREGVKWLEDKKAKSPSISCGSWSSPFQQNS